jgi:hemolysin III
VERLPLGKMHNPVRGFLHGTAAVVAAVGLGVLAYRARGDADRLIPALVFGMSLVAMYTVSSLYHSVPWTERWKARFRRLDHSMIFLVVAGTVTPIAVTVLDGGRQVLALAIVWVVAAVGIVLKFVLPDIKTGLSLTLQMLMGWSAVLWFPALTSRAGWEIAGLVVAGGLIYTVGVVIFASNRPRLFPKVFSAHELFHVLVIAASSLHFAAVLRLLPA